MARVQVSLFHAIIFIGLAAVPTLRSRGLDTAATARVGTGQDLKHRAPCIADAVKTTLDLKSASSRAVKAASKRDPASTRILAAVSAAQSRTWLRHGVPLARNDELIMIAEEVPATLHDG